MILSCIIYLIYCLHDTNISEMISGQGHVMRRDQGQMCAKFKNSEQKARYKVFQSTYNYFILKTYNRPIQ